MGGAVTFFWHFLARGIRHVLLHIVLSLFQFSSLYSDSHEVFALYVWFFRKSVYISKKCCLKSTATVVISINYYSTYIHTHTYNAISIDAEIDRHIQIDRYIDGWIDRQIDRQIDRSMYLDIDR